MWQTLLGLIGGGSGAGPASAAPSSGLNYLGGTGPVPPPTDPSTPGFGAPQGGPSFSQMMTGMLQNKATQAMNGGGGAGAGSAPGAGGMNASGGYMGGHL